MARELLARDAPTIPISGVHEITHPTDDERIGRYRLVDELGVGGMATVHLASAGKEGSFQTFVALKVSHRHLVTDPRAVRMFLSEARITSSITHPNVAMVHDVGRHRGRYFIALEYLPGETVRALMQRAADHGEPVPIEVACKMVIDAANGLHAAHELADRRGRFLGIVHRDVTPHNLMVTWSGVTKVIDFGIAHPCARDPLPETGPFDGKLSYLSPEQARGLPIDRRADIFSLGVILWELTTGRRLFRCNTDLETIVRVLDCDIARPAALSRKCPLNLDRIIMKALARERNDRYETALEFARALTSMLVRRGIPFGAGEVADYVRNTFAKKPGPAKVT